MMVLGAAVDPRTKWTETGSNVLLASEQRGGRVCECWAGEGRGGGWWYKLKDTLLQIDRELN